VEPALESRLDQLVRRHGELRDALSASGLSGGDFAKLSKEYSELSPIVDGIEALRRAQGELAAAKEMAGADDDPELQALAEEEMQSLRERLPELELTVKMALLPRDEDDERNAILEVRAGTGGEEAALFAAELFRMYQRYAVLRARLYEMERQALAATRAADRKSQVGSGDRSERIRTYNFPQGRVTDHRINLTLYKIDKIMAGEALDEVIDALAAADRAAKLGMAAE